MKPGRPSAAHLSVVKSTATGTRPSLTPLEPLTTAERKIFDLMVKENAHLRPADIPLLMTFARASAGSFKDLSAADFDKLARVAASLATKLRLTPQSRVNPLTLTRMQRQPLSYYERPETEDD
jgi:hypothetical protein